MTPRELKTRSRSARTMMDLAINGLPKRARGRQSPAAEAAYREQIADFCALIRQTDVGRALCRDAILEHIPAGAMGRYERKLDRARKQLRRALRQRVS
jgi:hypothetical protein